MTDQTYLYIWFMESEKPYGGERSRVKVYVVAHDVGEARRTALSRKVAVAIRDMIAGREPLCVAVPCAEINISNQGHNSAVIIGEQVGGGG